MDLKSLAAYPASSLAVWADPVAGAAYLDTLPGGLGSMLSGSSGEYDDYDYSPEEAPDEYAPIDNTSIDGTSAEDNAEYAEDYPWDNAEPESGFEAEAPADPTAEQMASLGKALKEGLSDLSAVEDRRPAQEREQAGRDGRARFGGRPVDTIPVLLR
jgi:hypothetical protein